MKRIAIISFATIFLTCLYPFDTSTYESSLDFSDTLSCNSVDIIFKATIHYETQDETYERPNHTIELLDLGKEGSFSGETFTIDYDEINRRWYVFKISITLNGDRNTVLAATYHRGIDEEDHEDKKDTYVLTEDFKASNIPLKSSSASRLTFRVDGEEVCEKIEEYRFQEDRSSTAWTTRTIDHCDEESSLTIEFTCDGIVTSTTTTSTPTTKPLLELTYPAGKSPKVFQVGWVFGARCTYVDENGKEIDISDQVSWSGSDKTTFSHNRGSRSSPTFKLPGQNTIELSVEIDGVEYKEEFQVEAVNTRDYARINDETFVPADSHGCLACPHPTRGWILSGSPTISIDGIPAARVGDGGIHGTCCGPNLIMAIKTGDENVLIDGRPAAKKGDITLECGGYGLIIKGSLGYDPDNDSSANPLKRGKHTCSIPHEINVQADEGGAISGKVTDVLGTGILGVGVTAYGETNIDAWGTITDENGEYQITELPDDSFKIHFWGGNWVYNDGYLSSWYNGKSSMDTADTVTITGSGSVTGIDVTLSAGGSISGTIKDASGIGIEKATVGTYGESGGTSFGYTDENGNYQIAGLASDSCRLYCDAGSQGYISEWYNDKSSKDTANLVMVTAPSQTSGIDFTLSGSGGISGTVKDASGNGIEEVYVKAFGESTEMTGLDVTDENGAYEILGLTDDSYRVQFQGDAHGYSNKWYSNQSNWDSAELVSVTVPNKTTGIDAELTLGNGVTTTTTTDGRACPVGKIYAERSEEVKLLRYFRDNVLNKTPEGQEIIRLYYEWSPAIVKAMNEDEEFKGEIKKVIDGVLELIEGKVE